eukprot:scaffold167077_cov21-Prasinocladus_malaysianus.AAC.1
MGTKYQSPLLFLFLLAVGINKFAGFASVARVPMLLTHFEHFQTGKLEREGRGLPGSWHIISRKP